MLAYTYPLLNIFWTMFMFFAFFVWVWLLIMIFGDIFRSRDIGGFAKALWVIFVIVVPVIGILAYLIIRGGGMHERAVEAARRQQEAADAYIRQVAGDGSTSTADQLAKLADLRERGVLTDEEYQKQKDAVLR